MRDKNSKNKLKNKNSTRFSHVILDEMSQINPIVLDKIEKKIRKKLRMKSWYWGNWAYENSWMDSIKISLKDTEFEEYIEEIHGWHHSEEFKNGQLKNEHKLDLK